jgi:glycosyltransferase involved in cell wall biosynthesis
MGGEELGLADPRTGVDWTDHMAPAVSVIIPTRDRWRLVQRSLSSVLRQNGVSVEVIIVDDASTEEPPPTEELESPQVNLVRHDTHRGVSAARNTGISKAGGEWLAFLDDDDVWAPHKLVTMLDSVAYSGAEFCYSAVVNVDDGLRVIGRDEAPPSDGLLPSLFHGNVIPGGGSNVIAHASLIGRTGEFDESFPGMEDWDMWIRFAECAKGSAIDEPLTAYSVHSESWSQTIDLALPTKIRRFAAKHGATAERWGVKTDFSATRRATAYKYFLAGKRGAAARSYLSSAIRERNIRDLARAGGALVGNERLRQLGLRNPTTPSWLETHAGR